MLEFYIKTADPKSHIQACEIISLMGAEILEDEFGNGDDSYYGFFHVNASEECFEVFGDFQEITLEIPPNKMIR